VADLLLCQATFLEAQKIQAYQRLLMTATEAATLAANASAKRLLLTHFSHRYDEINAFLHEARPIFSAVDTARDCARYAVSHHALISTPAT
jgi:ribonuclease Z